MGNVMRGPFWSFWASVGDLLCFCCSRKQLKCRSLQYITSKSFAGLFRLRFQRGGQALYRSHCEKSQTKHEARQLWSYCSDMTPWRASLLWLSGELRHENRENEVSGNLHVVTRGKHSEIKNSLSKETPSRPVWLIENYAVDNKQSCSSRMRTRNSFFLWYNSFCICKF